jgi:hypothetical protein
MRKNLRLLLCLLALGAAFGPAPEGAARQGVPRVGGFKPVATNDARVREAARNAVAAAAKREGMNIRLLSVVAAEQQVVQGMNYRLCLKVEIEDTENNVDVTTHVLTQVYMNLRREYQLRSWKEEDCGGEDDEEQ